MQTDSVYTYSYNEQGRIFHNYNLTPPWGGIFGPGHAPYGHKVKVHEISFSTLEQTVRLIMYLVKIRVAYIKISNIMIPEQSCVRGMFMHDCFCIKIALFP